MFAILAINGAFSQRVLKNSPNHLEQPSVLPIPTAATPPNAVFVKADVHVLTDVLIATPTAPIPGRASAVAAIKSLIPNIKLADPKIVLAPPFTISKTFLAPATSLDAVIKLVTPS